MSVTARLLLLRMIPILMCVYIAGDDSVCNASSVVPVGLSRTRSVYLGFNPHLCQRKLLSTLYSPSERLGQLLLASIDTTAE